MDGILLDRAARVLNNAKRVVVITGAGISVDVGIPAFKTDPDGLWRKYDPYSKATLAAFERDPEGFWRGVKDVAKVFLDAEPGVAHYAIAGLYCVIPISGVITSNIDGLHRLSGIDDVAELHGSIRRCVCPLCGAGHDTEKLLLPAWVINDVPRCCCNKTVVKPDVTLIGEPTSHETTLQAIRMVEGCDMALVVGTSGVFTSAGSWAQEVKRRGGRLIEINPETTALSHDVLHLQGKASEILPVLAERL